MWASTLSRYRVHPPRPILPGSQAPSSLLPQTSLPPFASPLQVPYKSSLPPSLFVSALSHHFPFSLLNHFSLPKGCPVGGPGFQRRRSMSSSPSYNLCCRRPADEGPAGLHQQSCCRRHATTSGASGGRSTTLATACRRSWRPWTTTAPRRRSSGASSGPEHSYPHFASSLVREVNTNISTYIMCHFTYMFPSSFLYIFP